MRSVHGLLPPRRAICSHSLRGLRRAYDVVLAVVLFRWSDGQVEGQVNRLKLVKRTMYDWASFRLLRHRALTV